MRKENWNLKIENQTKFKYYMELKNIFYSIETNKFKKSTHQIKINTFLTLPWILKI